MEETYAVAHVEAVSIAVIWATAGPALGVCAMRACLECGRPIEAVTESGRRLCHRCFGRFMRTQVTRCADCGEECWGERCRPCSTRARAAVRHLARKSWAEEAPLLRECASCGSLHERRSTRCTDCAVVWNRDRMRNMYRHRQGLPLDDTEVERFAEAHWAQ